MGNVIGVRFKNAGKLYFFDPGEHWPTPGDYVVVDTSHGLELGEVVTAVQSLACDNDTAVTLNQVVRVATAEDVAQDRANRADEKEAFAICQHKISEHRLEMKLVSVEYTFDRSKILFYFTANGRVDFRSLVKDLASVFHTRIELRQIGVRDEAKMLGGLGPCGRPICCGSFLGDFQPVSIKMAKEQNLSLNPTKISGVCGRLMCCLKYEEDFYEQTRKRMPRVGREIRTPDGYGTVRDLNIIKETVRVWVPKGDSGDLREYTLDDLKGAAEPNPDDSPAADTPATIEPAQEPASTQETAMEEAQQPVSRPRNERRERPAKREHSGDKSRRESRPPRDNRRTRREESDEEDERPARPPRPARKPEPVRRTAPDNAQKGNNWRAALEQAMQAASKKE